MILLICATNHYDLQSGYRATCLGVIIFRVRVKIVSLLRTIAGIYIIQSPWS